MTKFILEGLDCAHCAQQIETALRRVEPFRDARVNFATQSVHLEATHVEEAQKIIDSVEDGVVLRPAVSPKTAQGQDHGDRDKPWWVEALRLGAAAALFVLGLLVQGPAHDFRWLAFENLPFALAYLLVGFPVLATAGKSILRGRVFNEMFLMSLATLGAIAIQQLPEAVGVMLFYAVGEYLQDRAVARSRRSIAGLMDLRPEVVTVLDGDVRHRRSPEEVSVGELIEVLPGERIPLDGTIEQGQSFVDTSSLTGESVPRSVAEGHEVSAGYVNDHQRLVIRVSRPFGQSSVARILELVENATAQKAPTERFITKFAEIYTPAVVLVSLLVAVLPPLFLPGATFHDWIYRALVILVISCPCALVLSIPLGYFGGIGGASRNKLLIKGATNLDALTQVDTVVFDKTGTLTKGTFTVTQTMPRNGFTHDELLAWAAAAESRSSHPIARSIVAAQGQGPQADDVTEVKGHGVLATVDGHRVVAGNDRLLHRQAVDHHSEDCGVGGTVVYVAVDGRYAGYLVVSDEVKPEAAATVRELRSLGVRKVVMLTGDDQGVADRVSRTLGLDAVFAEQLPEDKVSNLEALMAQAPRGKKVVFVGDGMNDAPVLVKSDIGFAMGGLGSDAAIEAADVVVMDDRISRVPQALRIAAFTRRVVVQNIVVALGVKLVVVTLGIVGVADMWEAVIADVGVSLLAVLNAMRTIRKGR